MCFSRFSLFLSSFFLIFQKFLDLVPPCLIIVSILAFVRYLVGCCICEVNYFVEEFAISAVFLLYVSCVDI